MTREERDWTIEFGEKWLKSDYNKDSSIHRFFTLAIEALKAQPCEDCISREDVMQILWDYDCTNEDALMVKAIKELPEYILHCLQWYIHKYRE